MGGERRVRRGVGVQAGQVELNLQGKAFQRGVLRVNQFWIFFSSENVLADEHLTGGETMWTSQEGDHERVWRPSHLSS